MSDHDALVRAVAAIVEGGEESDAILRAAVDALARASGAGAGIRFVEEGAFSDGPWAGPAGERAAEVPIRYEDDVVAELVSGAPLDDAARAAWKRVADLLSPFCLVGWDIGGEDWEP
ncbi:MAG: hypothetical protein FJW81_01160 [Actinobacteria bacterium]|nr:hypothetical protein [Actinomycetota bacterium]